MSTALTLGVVVYAVIAVGTAIVVAFVDAPYGKFVRAGWGPEMSARWGWLLMESPSFFGAILWFYLAQPEGWVRGVLLLIWLFHYGYRDLIYPWLLRSSNMPWFVVSLGFAYNVFNAWINLTWVATAERYATAAWLLDPRFAFGLTLFLVGFCIHVISDHQLRSLRRPGGPRYVIPQGFLFHWVSCPNYFGEMLQWTGWAILTWSWPGALFALYTMANLGPRAIAHHQWYQSQFPDYPPERRALVPFLL